MASPIDRRAPALLFQSTPPAAQDTPQPATPAYIPHSTEEKSQQGWGEWLLNTAFYAAGSVVGYIRSKAISMADVSKKIAAHKEELREKSGENDYSSLIENFSSGLAGFIKETTAEEQPFLHGMFCGGATRAPELLELLIYHALIHLTNGDDSPNVIHSALEKVYEEIVAFIKNGPASLKSDFLASKLGDTEMEREKGKKAVLEAFEPLVATLAEQAGLDAAGLKEIMPAKAEWVAHTIKEFLLEQCVDIYDKMVIACELAPDEQKKLDEMGGESDVRALSHVIGQYGIQKTKTFLEQESHMFLGKINETAANSKLTAEDEIQLGKELKTHLTTNSNSTQELWQEAEAFSSRALHKGLCQIALKSQASTGSALERIEGYLITLFKEQKYDALLAKKIAKFQNDNAAYTKLAEELDTLKLEAINHAPPKTHKQKLAVKRLLQQIDRKTDTLYDLKQGIDVEMQALLEKSFHPLLDKLLADMGYSTPSKLPVPTRLQEVVWNTLVHSVLPQVLMKHYGTLETMLSDSVEILQTRHIHAENLKERYDDACVFAARPYAKFAIKSAESALSINLEKEISHGIAQFSKEHDTQFDLLSTLLAEKSGDIVEAAKSRLPLLVNYFRETIEQKVEDTIETIILKAVDNLTDNLSRLETQDPKRAFTFTLDVMTFITSHLNTVNEATEKVRKTHMYEVDHLDMLEQFQAQGILDPAIAGHALQKKIHDASTKAGELKQAISVEQSREKRKSLSLELQTTKEELKKLELEAAEQMKGNFFNDFTPYFLQLCGFNGPDDIPGPKEYREKFWNALSTTWGPKILLLATTTACKPKMLNKYLRIIAENINESLLDQEESIPQGPLNHEDEEMVEKCVELLEQVRRALPGTLVGRLAVIDEIRELPGPLMAQSIRNILSGYKLHQLFMESLVKGAREVEELLEEPLPMTKADQKAQEERANNSDMQRFQANAGTSIYSLHEKVMNVTKNKWNNFQMNFDEKVERTFGPKGSLVKSFLDKICRIVFINLLVWPIYILISIPLGLFYHFYSQKITQHADHLRKNIVETPIHANVGFQIARRFKELFPI